MASQNGRWSKEKKKGLSYLNVGTSSQIFNCKQSINQPTTKIQIFSLIHFGSDFQMWPEVTSIADSDTSQERVKICR